jgi:hypothetical protein
MSQVEWGPSMETANGTRQNANRGELENNIEVQEIDLSYTILPWSMNLDSGKLFTKTFGDKVGFRYYEDECRGIFWSNDPHRTIHQMRKACISSKSKRNCNMPGEFIAGHEFQITERDGPACVRRALPRFTRPAGRLQAGIHLEVP